jgi:hypothetical protein
MVKRSTDDVKKVAAWPSESTTGVRIGDLLTLNGQKIDQ